MRVHVQSGHLKEPDTVNTLLAKLIVQLKEEKNVIKTENAKYLICPLDGDDRQPFFTEKVQLEDSYVQNTQV